MSTVLYPNDPNIVGHIQRVMAERQLLEPAPRPVPTASELEQLLTVAYEASLEQDEGRRCTFTVAFYPRTGIHHSFIKPSTFEASIINRLASALDPSAANIAVERQENALMIRHAGFGRPDGFSITVVSPGVFVVRYGDAVAMLYRKGRTKFYPASSPDVSEALASLSIPLTFGQDAELRNRLQPRVDRFLRTTARIMLRLGHGGALVVMHGDSEQRDREDGGPHLTMASLFSPQATGVHASQAMFTAADIEPVIGSFEKLLRDQEIDPWRIKTALELVNPNRWLDQAARTFARLTATDGMTVIEDDLTLAGFGVFFTFNGRQPFEVAKVSPFESGAPLRIPLDGLGGARHLTAARVCEVFRTALVIVASQEGALSAMRWSDKENAVVVHQGLELLLHPFDDMSVTPDVAGNSLQLTPTES